MIFLSQDGCAVFQALDHIFVLSTKRLLTNLQSIVAKLLGFVQVPLSQVQSAKVVEIGRYIIFTTLASPTSVTDATGFATENRDSVATCHNPSWHSAGSCHAENN